MVQVWNTSKNIPINFGFDVVACIIEVLTLIDTFAFGLGPIKSIYFVEQTSRLTLNFETGSIKFGVDFGPENVHIRFGNLNSIEDISFVQLKKLVAFHKPKSICIHNSRMISFFNALRQYCIATHTYLEYHINPDSGRFDYCGMKEKH